ncbi:MAG: SurA N-terminal domain-containing protein [Pseudomonadota bacterium]
MLQDIRDKLTGWLVWVVVGLICVPFALWGVDSFFTGNNDPVVVKVGGQEITESQFRNGYDQRYQQFQAMMGENFRADMFDQAKFRQAVLDDMTQEAMMRQYVRKAGYRAGDASLINYLSSVPSFQIDGKFSTDAYRAALSRQGLTPQKFEAQLRDSLEIDQIRQAVIETSFVTDADVAEAYRSANEQRGLSYAVLDTAKYLSQVTVTDDQIKSRYETDKAKYMAPERIKLAYVELSLDALAKAAAPKADVLKVIYNAEKDSRFSTPEERKASHILIAFGADKAASKKKAEELAAKIKGGANFGDLAKQNSDDSGSKDQGGDLGWVKRGQMVDKFEKELFALGKGGEVSGVVETQYGWHLIRLDQIKAPHTRAFEDAGVQTELADLYRQREVQKRFQEQTEKLEQLAFENPASLDAVTKELKLEVQSTDWFTRAGGPGIAANDAVKQAAFSKEVVGDGDNSKPISLAPGKVVVIRKAEYEAPRQKPLTEVVETVRADLSNEAARAKAQTEATQMAAAARVGQSAAELATARGLTLMVPGLVRRDNSTEDRALLQALFRLPRPKQGSVSASEIKLSNGNAAVVVLTGVQDAPWPATDAVALSNAQKQLRDAVAGAEFGSYRKSIEKQIKVKVMNPPVAEAAPTPES